MYKVQMPKIFHSSFVLYNILVALKIYDEGFWLISAERNGINLRDMSKFRSISRLARFIAVEFTYLCRSVALSIEFPFCAGDFFLWLVVMMMVVLGKENCCH